jgi:hypothetical protein
MPPKTSKETQALAQRIVRTLYIDTDGAPRQWRMLSSFPGATVEAVMYALESGWIELKGDHSIRLTDEGKRLVIKQAH